MPARDNDVRFAEFLRIIDGDTFAARIHLAPKVRPRVQMEASIRVHNWSAAELNTEEGRHMRLLFEETLRTAGRIDVVMKTMSFERIVCAVWIDDELFAGLLTHELLAFRRAKADASDSRITGGVDQRQGSGDADSAHGVHRASDIVDRVSDGEPAAGREQPTGLVGPD
jgi:hypothetical protein